MQHTSDRKVCRAQPHTNLLLCGNVTVWGCTAILCESCVAALENEATFDFFQEYGTWLTFGIITASLGVSLILTLISYKRLKPRDMATFSKK